MNPAALKRPGSSLSAVTSVTERRETFIERHTVLLPKPLLVNVHFMKRLLFLGLAFLLFTGCTPEERSAPPSAFELVPPGDFPEFVDTLDAKPLREALLKSLTFYDKVPPETAYPLGSLQVSVSTLKATAQEFLKLLDTGRLNRKSVGDSFDVYRISGGNDSSGLLITGYFEPVLDARLEPDRVFCYPLYGLPSDLLTIELYNFDAARFPSERLFGRLSGKKVVPYHTRAEIDGGKKLEGTAPVLAWLRDPIDAFFLHVQGSGALRVPDGRLLRIGYAGANGRPYRSIGKVLLEKGVISSQEMSLQTIRAYLKAHPDERDDILWKNESYVFFRWVTDGPVGSLNLTLTSGRSLASDPKYYPRGALVYLQVEKPRSGDSSEVASGPPNRWVLNQDTGGAIKGVGRVDLFCGTGEAAEKVAGPLKSPGQAFIVIKKTSREN